jgi:multidrug efflux pump subunit AcrA (membrane-fusion protein)
MQPESQDHHLIESQAAALDKASVRKRTSLGLSNVWSTIVNRLSNRTQRPVASNHRESTQVKRSMRTGFSLRILRQLATLTGLWLVGAYWLAWPETRFAPGIVEYAIETQVDNATSGFLEQVHVTLGQRVHRGDVLVELSNIPLQSEIRDLELRMQQSEIRCRQLQRKGDLDALQDEEATRVSLMQSLGNKRRELQALQVKAPCDGLIVKSDFDGQRGRYLDAGTCLMTIADENSKRLRLSIAKEDFDTFYDRYDSTVVVDIPEKRLLIGSLSRFELPMVRNAGVVDAHAVRSLQEKLILPNRGKGQEELDTGLRFTALVDLPPEESAKLTAGQRAMIRYRAFHKSLAAVIASQYWNWTH